ncbi:hypothetical protein BGW39_004880 [Mortierella sp. 14UC]|nr:hypothetical protein BGW39_004880 [Mortierella sp. 14UC]
MERLEASTEFRPFKFRIQAFTNAFHDSLIMHGLTEDVLPLRKVKLYLWKHRYISRFNEDGKKQKSKGNHVWNIEARKISNVVGTGSGAESTAVTTPASTGAPSSPSTTSTPSTSTSSSTSSTSASSTSTKVTSTGFYDHVPPDMDLKQIGPEAISAAGGGLGVIRRPSSPVRWEFREYSSRIAGHVIKYARVGVPYVYSPRIWDAQMSCPAAKFSSPWLPSWLKWHRGELKGIPTTGAESCTIVVVAEYVREGEECRLEMSFPLTVCDPAKEGQEYQQQHSTSSSLAVEEGRQEDTAGGSGIDGAGAVGASAVGHDAPANHGTTSMKMQTEESTTTSSKEQQQQVEVEDEEMMVAVKEDEDMEDPEQDSSTHNTHSNNSHHTYLSNSHHHHQQKEHQREQRQAQQRLQRLQLQEHHHQQQQQQQQDQSDSFFQPSTAPSSAGTSASFFMNPPSSRGSISSSAGSAYIDEEEFSDDDDRDHDDNGAVEEDEEDEGMESTADGEEEGARRGTRSTRSTSKTTATSAASRQKPSRDRRSLVLPQDNKRRKHD